ncbi:hypothetical protein HMPREF0580_1106 [Mobiluncus mulieris ATCC 35239]|uniref:Uncharacterized protein n=1 Tax=Mobiluncus mulieris ATCC 35239 TaxID=871571 RepID=E0QQE1_9ACTO|nr:hypothetical protein HMPREF0577_0435 [Mobiluncus mulieris ATCC 35243]EFM46244.1 hypothetical protein HMPREF0580_1106 [Mobiluncus mulieris ATCC 35239]
MTFSIFDTRFQWQICVTTQLGVSEMWFLIGALDGLVPSVINPTPAG